MQMAVSQAIKLQHHCIAQCHSVKISILGEEGASGPRAVDPARVPSDYPQKLGTDAHEGPGTLKCWEDTQKCALITRHLSLCVRTPVPEGEQFAQAAGTRAHSIRETAECHEMWSRNSPTPFIPAPSPWTDCTAQ